MPPAPQREPSAVSPDELVLALRAGEERAAETLVRTHASWMHSVARRILHDKGLAEDCVQEAFINAYRNIDRFGGRASLKSWLHRIVVNQALMKLRTRKRHSESPIDDLLPAFDENACRIEEPWQPLPDPDEVLAQKERCSLVRAKVEQLPESYRIVLQLRDIEDMTTQEVAESLGLTEANVKVRLHRARSALKKLLEPVLTGDL